MLSERKILELVQALTTYSDSEDVMMDIVHNRSDKEKRPITKREKQMARALEDIYMFVHAKLQEGKDSCKHPDWAKEAEKMYLKLFKNKQL